MHAVPPGAALRLAEDLLARRSITPEDAGCQALIAARLQRIGFHCELLHYGPPEAMVTNLWAIREGSAGGAAAGPVLALAGHLDVVPPGPLGQWSSDPFVPSIRDGMLFGRGAADMKAAVAAMVVAAEAFVVARPVHAGALAFLLTSDEEGPSRDGTARVVEELRRRGQRLDACIVGEPTSVERVGDVIKNGRRGTLSARLRVIGVQGHVAYPQLARNPVHSLAPALAELAATRWDEGNPFFPPTSWQVSNIHAGTGAGNVIPGEAMVDFNFRFCTESTPGSLQSRVHEILQRHGVQHEISWTLGGSPFLCPAGTLGEALAQAITAECGIRAQLSTTGGTSDARFIATLCPQVIEFGALNATAHKVDECVPLAAIESMKNVYRRVLEALLP